MRVIPSPAFGSVAVPHSLPTSPGCRRGTRGSPGGPRHTIFASGTAPAGWVRGSVVGFDCRIEAGAVVEDSILFNRVSVGPGAEVRRAILDKGVRVLPGGRVGVDPAADRARGFVV